MAVNLDRSQMKKDDHVGVRRTNAVGATFEQAQIIDIVKKPKKAPLITVQFADSAAKLLTDDEMVVEIREISRLNVEMKLRLGQERAASREVKDDVERALDAEIGDRKTRHGDTLANLARPRMPFRSMSYPGMHGAIECRPESSNMKVDGIEMHELISLCERSDNFELVHREADAANRLLRAARAMVSAEVWLDIVTVATKR